MSIHDQIMQHAAADILVDQVGDRAALVIESLRPGEPIELDAIVAHEQVVPAFDSATQEWTETISRLAHVPTSELARVGLEEIPSRTVVWVAGVAYAAGQSRLTGTFQTLELKRTELVRKFNNEAGGGES